MNSGKLVLPMEYKLKKGTQEIKEGDFFKESIIRKLWYNRIKADKLFILIGLGLYVIEIIFTIIVVCVKNGDISLFLKSIPQMILWIVILVIFYWQIPKVTNKIDVVLTSLKENMSNESYEKFKNKVFRIFSHPLNTLTIILFVIAFNLPNIVFHLTNKKMSSLELWSGVQDPLLNGIFLPIDYLQLICIFFALSILFIRIFGFFLMIIRIKKYLDAIHLYHEDGGAGLSQIGEFIYYMIKVCTFLLVLGIVFAVSWSYLVEETQSIWLTLLAYACIPVILVLLIFIIPQYSIHQLIVDEKGRRKRKISEIFMSIDYVLLNNNVEIDKYNEIMAKMKTLDAFEKIVNNIPNWPFNMEQVIKVTLAAFTPIFTIFLAFLIEYIITLI